jgi:hypothetical protein
MRGGWYPKRGFTLIPKEEPSPSRKLVSSSNTWSWP